MRLTIIFLAFLLPRSLLAAPLTLGVHPYLKPAEIQKRFSPMAEYLKEELGKEVQIKVSSSYDDHIQLTRNNAYDISFLGPLSYVKMSNSSSRSHPLLGRLEIRGQPFFHSKIFTRLDSPIRQLSDLKGKDFAFGNTSSTMSYLVPRYMIEQAGVSLDQMKSSSYVGSHDNVVEAVLSGKADAGAVKEAMFFRHYNDLKAIATSTPVPEHLFVGGNHLSSLLIEQIRQALFKIDKELIGRKAMRAIKPSMTGIVPVEDTDYDYLRTIFDSVKQ